MSLSELRRTESTHTHGNAIPRWHNSQPIVDARELYSTLVDLLFL